MVSHDVEFCARYAQRCALFFDGNLAASGPPHTFFSGNSFYTTAANRMARQWLPQAVTAEDVIFACGGTPPQGDWQGRPEPVTDQPEPFTGVTDQPEQQNGNFLQEEPLAATEGGLVQKKNIDVLPLNQVIPCLLYTSRCV